MHNVFSQIILHIIEQDKYIEQDLRMPDIWQEEGYLLFPSYLHLSSEISCFELIFIFFLNSYTMISVKYMSVKWFNNRITTLNSFLVTGRSAAQCCS